MNRTVSGWLRGATIFFVLVAPFGSAFADASATDDIDAETSASANRWIPSFAVMGALTMQRVDASVRSFDGMGGELRSSASGEDVEWSPSIGLNLQLMSPALTQHNTQPRLFVNGELPLVFGVERNIAREGAANGFLIPESPSGGERPTFSEDAIGGQGSRTTTNAENVTFNVGLGMSFSFELGERRLQLKPSFGWRRYRVEVVGAVFDATCAPSGATTQCSLLALGGQRRLVSLGASQVETYDAIGPGLELEMDATQLGPFGISLFVEGRAYHVLGDRTITLLDSTTAPADPPAFPTADSFRGEFDYSVNPWLFHVGLGIRFSWLGH